MDISYKYFKRDISWLSFNRRVLMEAEDESLPLYERIKFLSIYASNLEEFYEIRVAEHRGVIMKKAYADEDIAEATETLNAITEEVSRQQKDFYRIFNEKIRKDLQREKVYLYPDQFPLPFHEEFVQRYFEEEVFPFLSPVMLQVGDIRTFLRDKRLYLIIRLNKKKKKGVHDETDYYALIKIPYAKVPRFVELPAVDGMFYYMFIDDIIRANLSSVFPGYDVRECYGIKISRDADIYIDEEKVKNILQSLKKEVKRRKIGALSRFMYDEEMPDDFLRFVCKAFDFHPDDLLKGGRYMNLQDLSKLPNPEQTIPEQAPLIPLKIPFIDNAGPIFEAVKEQDVLLHFPYQSFDYLLRFLIEAAFDPKVEEIKITQYRVAENSAVINALISAAQNGKKVTVFVELKARFDEENNMATAEQMERAGVRIIYSFPGLKVHAKVALITRRPSKKTGMHTDFAYLSTGNFNEKTAKIYSDMALLTTHTGIVSEVKTVFDLLEGSSEVPDFNYLLVARFNMVPELHRMIEREIEHVRAGRKGRILLKMNGLHERQMIDALYRASEAGVEIDLIVRGICCLVPNQPYSANIRVTRIVDMFLEHARIWYFYNDGREDLYLTSADWMNRNLNRRIETAFPILSPQIKEDILHILDIQLRDNVKACWLDEKLNNIYKHDDNPVKVRSQVETYHYIREHTRAE